jgi:hypothetical protein
VGEEMAETKKASGLLNRVSFDLKKKHNILVVGLFFTL